MKKILITGTGRAGTTFLIKIFTFLNFNTGFNKTNFSKFIDPICNSGMEREINAKFHVLKNPRFITTIDEIIENYQIEYVIIPLRNYESSALSRTKNKSVGGLWHAHSKEQQISYYHKIISEYIYSMVQHNIPTIFLHFEKMIVDKKYLFDKLQPIIQHKFEIFSKAYDEAATTSKPFDRSFKEFKFDKKCWDRMLI